jgi:arylsulfatase A-like enzyme
LLAVGLAIQTARVVHTRAARFERLVRRTVLPLALLLVLGATLVSGARMLRERSAIAGLNAARGDAPNVILLIWDTVRARSLSLYGHDRPTTPNLDAFARRGVVFDRAYAASSWTLPSHAAMFTGELPHRQTSSWVTPLDGTHPTLAEVFRDAGYVTAGFVANTRYADWEHGLARGFLRYEDYIVSPGEMLRSTALGQTLLSGSGGWDRGWLARIIGYEDLPARKNADRVNAEFLRWFDAQEDRPLFAFLNYFDAHQSYFPPEPYRDRFPPARAPTTLLERLRRESVRAGFWDMTPDELSAELAAYEGAISYLDDRLGVLLRELERRGALDNTIIVLASDHGEEFKEHGGEAHGTNLYSSQTHVPLVVAWRGRMPAGIRVSAPASLRDLPATLADLADLAGGDIFPGSSLASYWVNDAPAAPARAVLAELSPGLERELRMQSIIVAPHQLIRNVDGSLELYDVVADPEQRNALGADAEEASLLRLQRLLDELTQCTEARCCCEIAPAGGGTTTPGASRR